MSSQSGIGMTARAAMRVYIFHSHQFQAPVMSLFFRPHKSFDDVTLDDIRPPFHPPRYPTNGEFNFDTRLTLTNSVESDPLESSYLMYYVEPDPLEPSYPSVICLSLDSFSSSSAGHAPPSVCGHGFIRTHAIPHGRGRTCGGGRGDDVLGGF